MQRPARNSSLKALMAIKENSILGTRSSRSKKVNVGGLENVAPPIVGLGGIKRQYSPSSNDLPPNAKRKTLNDLTNQTTNVMNAKQVSKKVQEKIKSVKDVVDLPLPSRRRSNRLRGKNDTGPSLSPIKDEESHKPQQTANVSISSSGGDTPLTAVQNILKATTLSDDSILRCEERLSTDDEQIVFDKIPTKMPIWKDIDEAECNDPLFSTEYAPEVYDYMKRREIMFIVDPYLDTQPFIDAKMRTILVDWLVEVQENFELFHETLYLAVKIVDRYLERKEVKKEYLQLVGATAMLVASKFEELSPPLVDDFIYLCDDAYTHNELLQMECDILCTMDYDLNVPVAYRFLRRYARAAEADLPTHTLARYICESTLQEYEFVPDRSSLIAAGSMYLAVRMKNLGTWTPTLQHYSGYTIQELKPMVHRLNDLISRPPPAVGSSNGNAPTPTSTVRSKYSHSVFFEVALISPLSNVDDDIDKAVLELEELAVSLS